MYGKSTLLMFSSSQFYNQFRSRCGFVLLYNHVMTHLFTFFPYTFASNTCSIIMFTIFLQVLKCTCIYIYIWVSFRRKLLYISKVIKMTLTFYFQHFILHHYSLINSIMALALGLCQCYNIRYPLGFKPAISFGRKIQFTPCFLCT